MQRFLPGRVLSFCGALFIVLGNSLCAQTLFVEDGQVLALHQDSLAFATVSVTPSNGAVDMLVINPDIGVRLDAVGYSRLDRLIYAINSDNRHLVRIDADGVVEDLGNVGLDPNAVFKAGDVTPDGRYLVVVAQVAGRDQRMVAIDLSTPGFPLSQIILPGVTGMLDIAFHPGNPDLVFGYDAVYRSVVSIDYSTGDMSGLTILLGEHEIQSVLFNAFGELIALGTANSGVAGALFNVNQQTGELQVYTTGAVHRIRDLAAIPYSVEMRNIPSARIAFPCNELVYTFQVVNRTGTSHPGVHFETVLPDGFIYKGVAGNTLGGSLSHAGNVVQVDNMHIPQSGGQLRLRVEVGDVVQGAYRVQGVISGLADRYGSVVKSDDPLSPQFEDGSRVVVNSVDADSLVFSRFLCLGDSIILDGSQFGAEVQWNTGSKELKLKVGSGGRYVMDVLGGCMSTVVVFNVTAATCPFTISVAHTTLPEKTLPCQEMLFRYAIDNDTGTKRDNLKFATTLPDGVTFVSMDQNPFGGTLDQSKLPGEVVIEGMSVPLGKRDLDIRVLVGDIPPGSYPSQSKLSNLPPDLGPFRLSDDPRTPQHDSTIFEVLGVETDTLYVQEVICRGNELVLDGSLFGVDHIWFDGSTDSVHTVNAPGTYELVVFDGCEPTYIFFVVSQGDFIDVSFDSVAYHVRLGDSLLLQPHIVNDGDILNVWWAPGPDSSISCDTCHAAQVSPLFSTEYRVYAANEHCIDSADAFIEVDKTRRIFVPNIFTPNFDGINDDLILHSPDYGYIESFWISDRAGSVLYRTGRAWVNDESIAWDGRVRGEDVPAGVYVWSARIKFLDGLTEAFAGTVTIIR